MLYKLCSCCNTKYEYSSKCVNACMDKQRKERNRNYDKFSRNKESTSFYASGPWKKLTKQCGKKFVGMDIYDYYINGHITSGTLSHHIIELTEDKEKALDLENLIWLSDSSHTTVHVAYKNGEREEMQELLRELIERYEREF